MPYFHFFFFLNDPAPTEISPLPLHAALPIFPSSRDCGLALSLPPMMSARAINVSPFTTFSRQLPAEAEAQEVRPAQRTEVAVRIVEADLPVAAAVPDPAADRQTVGGEAGRVVLRREAGVRTRIEGVGDRKSVV